MPSLPRWCRDPSETGSRVGSSHPDTVVTACRVPSSILSATPRAPHSLPSKSLNAWTLPFLLLRVFHCLPNSAAPHWRLSLCRTPSAPDSGAHVVTVPGPYQNHETVRTGFFSFCRFNKYCLERLSISPWPHSCCMSHVSLFLVEPLPSDDSPCKSHTHW